MSISIWGWGSSALTTAGFGYYSTEWIPILLAEYLENSNVYTCVLTRDYVEVLLRITGDVVLRVRPDQIPVRERGELMSRIRAEDVLVRSKGWPWQGDVCLDDET